MQLHCDIIDRMERHTSREKILSCIGHGEFVPKRQSNDLRLQHVI